MEFVNCSEIKPYLLIHITAEEILKEIEKSNGFKESKHDLEHFKNEWLGDGVYFWDGNDEVAIDFGKNMISKKVEFKNKKLIAIYVNVDIASNNYINLEESDERNDFYEFILIHNPENGQQTIDIMEMLRKRKYINKRDLADVGKFLGDYINAYSKYLLKNFGEEIKMVSCYFFHKKNELYPFARGELAIRQFCVKDVEFLNQGINDWKIVNL
ncbi:MAG: hypothetical protein ACI4U0_01595 [Candidatus Aphodocola sp.]